MPKTTKRQWVYPKKGTKPYFSEIAPFYEQIDTDVDTLFNRTVKDIVPTMAKGSLISDTGTDTSVLPVGPNGYALVADSSQPSGLKWVSPSGGNRYNAVLDYVDNTSAPPSEGLNDRYLLDFTGGSHADWDGASPGDLVEFNGTTWESTTPVEGYIVYVDAENQDRVYIDDGSPNWEPRPTALNYWNKTGNVLVPTTSTDGLSITASGEDISLVTDRNVVMTSGMGYGVTINSGGIVTGVDINATNGPFDVTCYSGWNTLVGNSTGWKMETEKQMILSTTTGPGNIYINSGAFIYADGPNINIGTQPTTTGDVILGNLSMGNLIMFAGAGASLQANTFDLVSNNIDVSSTYNRIVVGPDHNIDTNTTYSAIFGASHDADWSPYTLISGQNHDIINASDAVVFGKNHVVNVANASVIGGQENDIADSYRVAVFGLRNEVDDNYSALVSGQDNQVLNYSSYAVVGGQLNELDSSENTAVFGSSNVLVASNNSLVSGTLHDLTNVDYSVVTGDSNTMLSVSYSFAGGTNNTYNSIQNSVLSGANHYITYGNYCGLFGYENFSSNLYQSILSGYQNIADSMQGSIASGNNNAALSNLAQSYFGGYNNKAITSQYSIVGGSNNNLGYGNFGTSISFSFSGGTVTLTDTDAPFNPSVDGEEITVTNTTSSGNTVWSVPVTYISSTQVSYSNPSGVTEPGNDFVIWRTKGFNEGSFIAGREINLSIINQSLIVGHSMNQWGNFKQSGDGVYGSVVAGDNLTLGDIRSSLVSGGYHKVTFGSSLRYSIVGGESHNVAGSGNLVTGYDNSIVMANTGTSISFSQSGSTTTLTDSSGKFEPYINDKVLQVSNAKSSGNNGNFTVTYISPTQVSYTNSNGVTESGHNGTSWSNYNSSMVSVGGQQNKVYDTYQTIVHGFRNEVRPDTHESQYNAVFGSNHHVFGSEYCLVAGTANALSSECKYTTVIGNSNEVTDSEYSLVAGYDNTVSAGLDGAFVMATGSTYHGGHFSLMVGFGHDGIGNSSVMCGSSNKGEGGANNNVIGGSDNEVIAGSQNNLVVGAGNYLNGAPSNSIIGGTNSLFREGANSVLSTGTKHMGVWGPNEIALFGNGQRTTSYNSTLIGVKNACIAFNIGTTISLTKGSGNQMTITDTDGYLPYYMNGKTISITGAVNGANNGNWVITVAPDGPGTTATFEIPGGAGVSEGGNENLRWQCTDGSSSNITLIGGYNYSESGGMQYGLVSGMYNYTGSSNNMAGAMFGTWNVADNGPAKQTLITGHKANGSFYQRTHVNSGGHPETGGQAGLAGEGQCFSMMPMSRTTSGATSATLYIDGAETSEQFYFGSLTDHVIVMSTYVVAKCKETNSVRSWKFDTTFNNVGGVTSVVGTNKTPLHQTSPAVGNEASWDADVVLNGTNITVLVQGGAGETVRWQAHCQGADLGIN